MIRHEIVRLVLAIAIGLGLASVPFLQYGALGHHHAPHGAHAHSHQP